jgi:hypothetical protein
MLCRLIALQESLQKKMGWCFVFAPAHLAVDILRSLRLTSTLNFAERLNRSSAGILQAAVVGVASSDAKAARGFCSLDHSHASGIRRLCGLVDSFAHGRSPVWLRCVSDAEYPEIGGDRTGKRDS